ncbi:hypothetical protein PM082_000809 [Marasmius tenuissimus]|nr:hypothetical protein PM082_000809 [Marasmius tenuissimus]
MLKLPLYQLVSWMTVSTPIRSRLMLPSEPLGGGDDEQHLDGIRYSPMIDDLSYRETLGIRYCTYCSFLFSPVHAAHMVTQLNDTLGTHGHRVPTAEEPTTAVFCFLQVY